MYMTRLKQGVCVLVGLLVAGASVGFMEDPKDRACKTTKPTIPAAPFKLRYKFNVGWEHGCSRSMESYGEVGSLRIEVDAKGKAVLRLDLFHGHTFGPSYGEYKRGHRDFSHDDSRFRAVWTGKAERTDTGLVLRFSKQEISNEQWGSDFKPESTKKSDLTLTCHASSLLLDPPFKEPEPPPECAAVILCKPSETLLSFKHERVRGLSSRLYFKGSLPFAPKPGLEANIKQLYNTGWDYLRRVKR
jgi:hypothetical protein